jgi:uncharacterized protein with NAD-binding domain and iron-sulfur cluster
MDEERANPTQRLTKVAILGGGMGALAAAWELSHLPATAGRFDITIYQRGWRLGGKGASGTAIDASDRRIEEHGLHILMGFYKNAFDILKDCYAALAANPEVWPGGSLISWEDALTAQGKIWVAEPFATEWNFWEIPFDGLTAIAAGASAFQKCLDDIWPWIRKFRDAIPRPVAHSRQIRITVQDIATLPEVTRQRQLQVRDKLLELLGTAWADAKPSLATPDSATGLRIRQAFSGLYLAIATLVGWIEDGVIIAPHDFSVLDRFDYKEWLRDRGRGQSLPPEISWQSPLVRALYDLVFSLQRSVAAGVTCYHLLNILFGWTDGVYFKMNGAMGDIVFAPLYLTLKHLRNVKFRFFHRVTNIEVDQGDQSVCAITLEPQVRGLCAYDPMFHNTKRATPSWPNMPILKAVGTGKQRHLEQLPFDLQRDLADLPFDFETEAPSPFAGPPVVLKRDDDFDIVILGISVGGLKGPLGAALRQNRRFNAMLNAAQAMPTQAFQAWLKAPPGGSNGLGWVQGRAMSGYAEPYSACTDMNQVLPKENFPSPQPHTVAYFCGAFPDAPDDKPTAVAQAQKNAERWLDESVFRLWPAAAKPGHFDPSNLVDVKRGFYVRANTDCSDRYVISPPGSIVYRLAPDESGFTNLFLAGDWVRNDLSSGCLESAALGGRLAGQAILQRVGGMVRPLLTVRRAQPPSSGAPYARQDGDWVVRPPGMLEDVQMHAFIVPATLGNLKQVCANMINVPSGDAVTVSPLPFVIVACAAIGCGYSLAAPEEGQQTENDLCFFVPVELFVHGKRQGFAAIVPYIFVDNMAGMITGREVFGFPKLFGDMTFSDDGTLFEAFSLVRKCPGFEQKVTRQSVVRIQVNVQNSKALSGQSLALLDEVTSRALGALGLTLSGSIALGQVPLVFLKQFRDAVDPRTACFQSIVQTNAQVTAIHSARVLTGHFSLTLPRYDSLRIADTLGLREPLPIAFALNLDFKLPVGTTLWQAGA